jgi:DNA polymerase-3 subunit gamma/tau
MSETLYRKYRPARFEDVAEQEHVVKTIQNQIASGTLAHAYLFSGSRGIGKTTIARLLAKAVNCLNRKEGESEPCGICDHCLAFGDGRFLDTVEIDAASNTGVDNVRENIIENVRFVPQQGKYKVFVIDEVHMLSASAFNALLKTLEEPPAHVIFILATTELHKIPATIVSRCQRFDFHKIAAPEMVARLLSISKKEGVEVDDEVLRVIVKISEGCLRDAESLLGQVLSLGDKHITASLASLILPVTTITLVREIIDLLVKKDVGATLDKISAFVVDGGSIKHFTDELIEEVREDLMNSISGKQAVFESVQARRLLDLLLTARGRHSLSALPQLPLELALVEFMLGDDSVVRETANLPVSSSIAAMQPNAATGNIGGLVAPRSASDVKIVAVEASLPPLNIADNINSVMPITFTLAEIQDKWERCCDKVNDLNVSLPITLRTGKPIAINGSKLTVSFPYAFHADALKDAKNLRLLEDAIAGVMMQRPIIVTEVVAASAKEEAAVALLTDAFGGNVV